MSKFFTWLSAPLLAPASLLLASEAMPLPVPPPVRENPEPTASAAVGLPVALAAGRFASLGKKSPFTLASTTEVNADFAKDLFIAGFFRVDGKDFILVGNRTSPSTRLVVGTEPSPGAPGLVLEKLNRDPGGELSKLRARVRKGTETALLSFQASSSLTAPTNAPAGPSGMSQPGASFGQGSSPSGVGGPQPNAVTLTNPPPDRPATRRRGEVIDAPPAR